MGSGFPVVSTTSSNFRSVNAASDTLAANKRLDLEKKQLRKVQQPVMCKYAK